MGDKYAVMNLNVPSTSLLKGRAEKNAICQ